MQERFLTGEKTEEETKGGNIEIISLRKKEATRNKCIASSNKCLTSSNIRSKGR